MKSNISFKDIKLCNQVVFIKFCCEQPNGGNKPSREKDEIEHK